MKIGFVSPYWDTLGGGERYLLTMASQWSKKHEVLLLVRDESFINEIQARLGIDLSRVKLTRNFFQGRNLLTKVIQSKFYDLLVFVTDGSLPTTWAKRNFLHIQAPFNSFPEPEWKLRQFHRVICNSNFTQNHIDSRLRKNVEVIYPPIDLTGLKESDKEQLILSVGRFSSLQTKKHEVLISAFKKIKKENNFAHWKLVIVGGLMESDRVYFTELNKQVENGDIELRTNISRIELTSLYGRASIYWHGAGFGETDPVKMEHFGISTVEAMASGCIPIVYGGGGLPEIVEDKVNGYLWRRSEELIDKTRNLINNPLRGKIKQLAIIRAKKFSLDKFNAEVDKLLEKL